MNANTLVPAEAKLQQDAIAWMVGDPNTLGEEERIPFMYQWDPYVLVVQQGHKEASGIPARSSRVGFILYTPLVSGIHISARTLLQFLIVVRGLAEVFGIHMLEMYKGDPLNHGGNRYVSCNQWTCGAVSRMHGGGPVFEYPTLGKEICVKGL